MGSFDLKSEILRRLEILSRNLQAQGDEPAAFFLECFQDYLDALERMISGDAILFGVEPWHALDDGRHSPGELLLRLQNENGENLPPYPFVEACYNRGLAAQLDAILVLAALREYALVHRQAGEAQGSINISGRSLEPRNRDNIEVILQALDVLKLKTQIVFEILEGFANTNIDLQAMRSFERYGVSFAIDDVSLQVGDIFRLAGFGEHIKYVKLDYQFVQDHEMGGSGQEFFRKLNFISQAAPRVVMIAEGVRDVDHARWLNQTHGAIVYAQGRDLPARDAFAKEWSGVLQ